MLHQCKLVADIAALQDNKVLLVRYKNINKYDHQFGWFLPDDLLKAFEHPEIAVKRIVKEQLGLEDFLLKGILLSHVESFKGNDSSWHLVFHFKFMATSDLKLQPSKDVEEIKWFALDNLPDRSEVAHHGWALTTIDRMVKD